MSIISSKNKTLNTAVSNAAKIEYDVVVVGSGLGGLTAANRLGRFGRRVLLLEQHFELGGLAAYFRRGEHIFDVSLHGFPYGMVKTCRKYWSREIADAIFQIKRIVFDNPQFSLETTFDTEDFTRILIDYFGVDKQTVDDFFKTVGTMDFFDDKEETVRDLFDRFFPDRSDVVRFLMEPMTYANGSTLDEPAITYGIVFSNFMNGGVFTVRGGTDWIINKMREELGKNGVDIITKVQVGKILIENGKTFGVKAGGKTIRAKSVLSNANLKATVLDLIGEENVPSDYALLARDLRLSNSSAQVYLGLRKGEVIDDVGDLLFTSTASEFDSNLLLSNNITSRTFSIYYPKIRPDHNRYTIVASMNAKGEDWTGLSRNDYTEAKNEMVEDSIKALEKYLPGIRDKIDYMEAATPKTFERYTGHWGGASFGSKFEGLEVSSDLPKAVKGVYHTGSAAIIMSGWLGAANYGVIVANKVEEYLDEL